jgi:predicted RNA-binding protein associated with RNAse of E/G family
MRVWLRKAAKPKIDYPAELVSDDGVHIVVEAPFAGEQVRDFGFVRFEPGDVFVEHYWRDRWFAVAEVRGADGVLKGWYCDVTRPAVLDEQGDLVVDDLDLDLWRSADGLQVLRLDEDEFAASGLVERDPAAAAQAVAALDELEILANTEQGFDRLLA